MRLFIAGVLVTLRMLLHNKPRLVMALIGVVFSFILSAALLGLLAGWCDTNSAIIRHAGVDLWLMAPMTEAFDYGTALPRNLIYRARSVPGVAWAEGLYKGWDLWKCPNGKKIMVEVVGLDDSCVGGPWKMREGRVQDMQRPESVVVDSLYLGALGVAKVGDTVEIQGYRSVIAGISSDVRTFTASPFVFMSMRTARRLDARYKPDEVEYVMVRCAPREDPEKVRDLVAAAIPTAEVLTTRQFSVRTVKYWILGTGAGATLVVSAVLGLFVGMVIVSQTLYATTLDHMADYATLLAMGFSRTWIVGVVVAQSLVIGALGVFAGYLLFVEAMALSTTTTLLMETTPLLSAVLVLATFSCCGVASVISVRAVFRIDPVSAFKG